MAKAAGDDVSALEPDFYRATVRGVQDQTVMVDEDGFGFTAVRVKGAYSHDDVDITDARPLIVLDIATWFPHRAAAIIADFDKMSLGDPGSDAFLIDVLTQIEAQTKPVRIPEPDPGEHVTACVMSTPERPETFLHLRLRKLRNETPYDWACLTTGHCYMWDSLIDPTPIRDGIES